MPAYQTPEYRHLLAAEQAIARAIEPRAMEDGGEVVYPEATAIASLAGALVRVIDQKRVMRGQGAPKPVEGRASKRKHVSSDVRPTIAAPPNAPSSPPTAGEAAPPSPAPET